jgi:type II secretion system protein J
MCSAFTLVEMLITASMLALIATAGFAVFSGGIRSAAKVKRYGEMLSNAQMALRAMSADIRAALAYGNFRLVSLDVQHEQRDCDTIDFIIIRPNPQRKEPDEGGRAEVGYYIDNDPDTEAQWLLRREDRTLDDDPLEGGYLSLAGPFVSELNLEFYDGLAWQSGWDDRTKFPKAVRIQIVVQDEKEIEKPRVFSTTVPIMAQ